LPNDHVVRLVSELPAEVADRTFARRADSIEDALRDAGLDPARSLHEVVVLWRAGEMIPARGGAQNGQPDTSIAAR
jgi:hypothetical protein